MHADGTASLSSPTPERAARAVWILTACTALALMGDGTVYAVLPSLYPAVGISVAQVGMLLSVNRLVRPPLNMFSGWLSSRIDPRLPYTVGLAIGACSTLGYGLVRGFWPLLALRALWGVAWALIAVSAYAMVLDVTATANRGRYAGSYHSLSFFGGAVGAMGGGFLADALGFQRTMLMLGLLSMAAVALAFTLPRRPARDAVPSAGTSALTPGQRSRLLLVSLRGLDARLWLILSLNFVERLFFAGVFYGTLGYYLKQALPGGMQIGTLLVGVASLTGVLLFARNALSVLSGPTLGYLSDRLGDRTRMLLLGEGFGVLGLLLLGAGDHLALILLAVALTALANGVVSPMLMSWMGDLTRRGGRGTLVGAFQTMGDLGSGLGPLIAYPLMAALGTRPVYLLCAALLSLTIPLILWARRAQTIDHGG
jgi:MFS family permease